MRLEVTVPITADAAPDDENILRLVHGTIAAKASAWTEPEFEGERDGWYVYATDAQPKPVPGVTLDKVDPALRPARIVR